MGTQKKLEKNVLAMQGMQNPQNDFLVVSLAVFSGDSTNNDGLGVTPQCSGWAKQIIMLS